MEYKEFIEQLNALKIKEMTFNVDNYKHYSNCKLLVDKSTNSDYPICIFTFELTKDKSERMTFYKRFDEKARMFTYKSKGSFTLKEIWKHIEITNIVYYD